MPRKERISIAPLFDTRSGVDAFFLLTCSWASRHTFASGTVDCAGILLQRFAGDTASAVGCLAVLNLAARGVADAFNIGDSGRGDGDEAKENGGDRKLHLGGFCEFKV